uniref:peptidase inhibitor family I36 protein n=1 Tax=Kitasatospora sp. SC0581 TaxID=3394360 RepID=UPI003A8807C1
MYVYAKTALLVAAVLTACLAVPAAAARSGTALGACGPGRLCLWSKPDFKGRAQSHELATTDIDSCVALPPG